MILPAVIVTALFFTVILGLADIRCIQEKPVTGSEGLIGLEGIANTDITKDSGMVLLHGEIWSAYSDDDIKGRKKIIIESVSGRLRLKVKEGEK